MDEFNLLSIEYKIIINTEANLLEQDLYEIYKDQRILTLLDWRNIQLRLQSIRDRNRNAK